MKLSFTTSILAVLLATCEHHMTVSAVAPAAAPAAAGKQPATSLYTATAQETFLANINVARAKYGADCLLWNDNLFSEAAKAALSCKAPVGGNPYFVSAFVILI